MGSSASLGATASSIGLGPGRGPPAPAGPRDRLEQGTDRSGQKLPDVGQGQADRMVLLGRRHRDLFQRRSTTRRRSTRGCSLEERLSFSMSLGGVRLALGPAQAGPGQIAIGGLEFLVVHERGPDEARDSSNPASHISLPARANRLSDRMVVLARDRPDVRQADPLEVGDRVNLRARRRSG